LKGPNLSDLFILWCNQADIQVVTVELRSGAFTYLNINDSLCYLKYANLNSAGNYYFGFATKDLESNFENSIFTIILCGRGRIDNIFIIPSRVLAGFLIEGRPVRKKRAVYEEYQASIFPHRNFEMTVTHRRANPIDMRQFEVGLERNEILGNLTRG